MTDNPNDLAAKVRDILKQAYIGPNINTSLVPAINQLLALFEQHTKELEQQDIDTSELSDGLDPNDSYYASLPDNIDETEELRKKIKELEQQREQDREMLMEAKLQLEYLNQKFHRTGTTHAVLAKIEQYLTAKETDK